MRCYGNGDLVGDWFDAIDADDITTFDVHRSSGHNGTLCEEFWIFDHEGLGVDGELSPHEAAEWARSLTSVDEHLRPALRQWVASGDYVAEGTGDLPSIPDFEDRYCGEYCSFREYSEELADDIKDWVANWNNDPKPIVWHKTADQILEQLAGYCTAVLGTELPTETA